MVSCSCLFSAAVLLPLSLATSSPICGSESFGQGFDSTQLTLHGNGYTLEHMPKKTVFFVNDTFESSCGKLPLCVRETKSCDVEEMMFATMVKAETAKYLSEGMQLDVEISLTTGSMLWESTSTMTQSYSENLKYLETQQSIVVLQGGYGHIWSGSCSIRDESVSYSETFEILLGKIATLPLELSSSVADDVIEMFGTTVATGGFFGGSYVTTFYSTQDLYAAFLSASATGEQGIHDSGYFWSVGGTASTMKETADGILWEKSYLERHSSSLGVAPPADGSSYVKAIGNDCVPTRLELLPLHAFVEIKGIDGLDSAQVRLVVSQLEDAEIRYCYKIGACGSSPTPQPTKSPDLFGGLYWVKDCQDCGAGDPNPFTKGFNCPSGTKPYPIGRTLTPEEKTGSNLFLCLRDLTIHEDENFGGMYQLDDVNSQDNRMNPITNGYNCSSGYRNILVARVTTPEPQWSGASIFYCFKEVESLGDAHMGGFYMQADVGTQGNVANQYTLTTSCPNQYTPYRAGRHYGPESKVGMNLYVCLNNVD